MRAAWVSLVLVGSALAGPALAAEHVLRIEPETSRVSLTLKSTLHTVDGELSLERGEIRFDPATGEASGEVVFDAGRTDTGNADRDRKMHRKVLESELFPEIVFVPATLLGEIPESGDGDLELAGTVTVHGGSHPVSLKAHITREGDHIHATSELPIPYVEWGMKDPSVLVLRVAKEVNIAIDVYGVLTE